MRSVLAQADDSQLRLFLVTKTASTELDHRLAQQVGQGRFPFLYVQLANFKASAIEGWPYLRESQLKTLSLPNTGMATAIDIGVPDHIHPQDKSDVGRRLALTARHVAYGEKLVYSGPTYAAMTGAAPSISVRFTQTGSGLCIGKAPWVPTGFQALPTDKLVGFTIAGADKNWVPADAKIDGDAVVVSSAQVPNPVAVRHDGANNAQGNLYNNCPPRRSARTIGPTPWRKVSSPRRRQRPR